MIEQEQHTIIKTCGKHGSYWVTSHRFVFRNDSWIKSKMADEIIYAAKDGIGNFHENKYRQVKLHLWQRLHVQTNR